MMTTMTMRMMTSMTMRMMKSRNIHPPQPRVGKEGSGRHLRYLILLQPDLGHINGELGRDCRKTPIPAVNDPLSALARLGAA